MTRGDILLYRQPERAAPWLALADLAIALRTRGPYVHVGVAVDHGLMVDATPAHGVTVHPLVTPDAWYPTSAYATPQRLSAGVCEVLRRVHADYGWRDIAEAGVLPGWWPVLAHGAREFDCSHLVADFLVTCGLGALLGGLRDQTARVSPNDLARALGVLKG